MLHIPNSDMQPYGEKALAVFNAKAAGRDS